MFIFSMSKDVKTKNRFLGLYCSVYLASGLGLKDNIRDIANIQRISLLKDLALFFYQHKLLPPLDQFA